MIRECKCRLQGRSRGAPGCFGSARGGSGVAPGCSGSARGGSGGAPGALRDDPGVQMEAPRALPGRSGMLHRRSGGATTELRAPPEHAGAPPEHPGAPPEHPRSVHGVGSNNYVPNYVLLCLELCFIMFLNYVSAFGRILNQP